MDNVNQKGAPSSITWTPELVNEFWDGLSRAGLDDQKAFGRMAQRCIHWIIARHLTPDGRHLDYGGGSGDVAKHLIAQGFPFAVFDPAQERQAKSDQVLEGNSGFLGGYDASKNGTFDAVTCFEVLEHVLDEEIEKVCDELVAALKPGGKLIVTTPNSENLSLDMVYCPVSNCCFHRWQHVRTITPEWMLNTFTSRGLEKICIQQLDFSEGLFEPYLHMMGHAEAPKPPKKNEIVPLHIHNIMNDVDGVCGGATSLLFVGQKPL